MPLWDDLRAAWKAAPSTNDQPVAPSSRTGFMTHWDGPAVGIGAEDDHQLCLDFMLAMQRYHQQTRGWADIGYNGVVCVHGRAIEGRGADQQGAHCPNYNVTAYGVQVMVGTGDPLPDAARARQRRLYDDMSARSGKALTMLGHRDGAATDCPGDELYAWVKAGMPAPDGGDMSQQQYDAIMKAIADLSVKVDGKADKAAVTDLAERVSTGGKAITDAIAGLPATINTTVREAVDSSLDGVEVSARYVRQK